MSIFVSLCYDKNNMTKKKQERKKTISCGAVVYKKNDSWEESQILLVKQFAANDGWGIPKGHINSGESFEDCAVRETFEETGLQVKIGQRLRNARAVYKTEEKTIVAFLAVQVCSSPLNFNGTESEVVAAQWHKIGELPRIYTYQQPIIEEALQILHKDFE